MQAEISVIDPAKERRVWVLISAACVVPALLSVVQQYIVARLDGRSARWQDLVFSGGDWIVLGALTPIAYFLGKRFPLERNQWKPRIAVHVASALVLAVGWASLGMVLGMMLHRFPAEPPLGRSYLSWIFITIPFAVLMYFAVLVCVYAYAYFIEARQREADASRLTAQLAEARLGALRAQLNPHFLFNSLNAVSVLVREQNTAGASGMLDLLSDVLREVLRSDQPHEIAFADELRFLEQYLAIEQVRFSDRLHVQWSIEDRTRDALVPIFALQPLVENAIKHGVARRAEAGTVAISSRIVGADVELGVRDDGVGMAPPGVRQEGVGLSNTRERLRALYGDAASVTINTPQNGGTEVVLRIPFRTMAK